MKHSLLNIHLNSSVHLKLSDEVVLPFWLVHHGNNIARTLGTALISPPFAYQSLFGLSIPEWRLVAVIAEEEAVTQAAIGTRTRMDKVTVSRAAIALAGRGLVERRPNKGDRRSHLLALTSAGQELYRAVAPKALELEARLFAGFSAAEREACTAAVDRRYHFLHHRLRKSCSDPVAN